MCRSGVPVGLALGDPLCAVKQEAAQRGHCHISERDWSVSGGSLSTLPQSAISHAQACGRCCSRLEPRARPALVAWLGAVRHHQLSDLKGSVR